MAKLILELIHQGRPSYHKLDEFPVMVGRAYDCDVVVPDITVSPRHLTIDKTEQGYELCSLGNENGTSLNKAKLPEKQTVPLTLPATLMMGELRAKLVDPQMQVAPTQITSTGHGWFSFLSNPFWAVLFVVLTALTAVVSKHTSTPVVMEELIYFNALLLPLLSMFVVAFLIAIVSRLTMHRWAFIPALSISGLLFLAPLLFDHLGHFLAYLTTSGLAASIVKYLSSFLLLPLLLTFYLKRVHYTHWLSAMGIAVLVTMPVSAFFASDLVQEMSNHSGFTPMPKYNKTLSAFDLRAQKTLDVDVFLQQSEAVLSEQVEQLLVQASD
ncbi:MAG: FHA domain-containing protein [Leucothrix sp.]